MNHTKRVKCQWLKRHLCVGRELFTYSRTISYLYRGMLKFKFHNKTFNLMKVVLIRNCHSCGGHIYDLFCNSQWKPNKSIFLEAFHCKELNKLQACRAMKRIRTQTLLIRLEWCPTKRCSQNKSGLRLTVLIRYPAHRIWRGCFNRSCVKGIINEFVNHK